MKKFINVKTGVTHLASPYPMWPGHNGHIAYCGRHMDQNFKPGKTDVRCKRCLLSAETTKMKGAKK